jgi:hypothetical protein
MQERIGEEESDHAQQRVSRITEDQTTLPGVSRRHVKRIAPEPLLFDRIGYDEPLRKIPRVGLF